MRVARADGFHRFYVCADAIGFAGKKRKMAGFLLLKIGSCNHVVLVWASACMLIITQRARFGIMIWKFERFNNI